MYRYYRFFFKQKTAYEVRISDWSSDVCSSDLLIFSMGTPGIEVRPLKTMTGHAEFNETFFTDVRVPMHHIVGQRGQGWFVANATLGHERGMLGDPDALENRLQALIALMQEERLGQGRAIDNQVLRDRSIG